MLRDSIVLSVSNSHITENNPDRGGSRCEYGHVEALQGYNLPASIRSQPSWREQIPRSAINLEL